MNEEGKFIHGNYGSRFMFSLLNDNIMLNPGKYVIMIDPLWDETTFNDEAYRDVLVDIYGPQQVSLCQVETKFGMKILVKALKHFAQNELPEDIRDFYLRDNEDYE